VKKTFFSTFFALAGIGLWAFQMSTQDLSQYDSLKEPRITSLPSLKMLVVEAQGDPNVAGQRAFAELFKVFFSMPGVRMSPPRARWLNVSSSDKSAWIGLYALPIPAQATNLPPGSGSARIEIWPYGEVAEMMHVGPYGEETPAIQKLINFIDRQGYVIAGPHEEEYLRGPESGPDASQYRTIIRYQVKKKSPLPPFEPLMARS